MNTDLLSQEWFKAVSEQSKIAIPEHVAVVLEIIEPIVTLAINDYKSKAAFHYKPDNSPVGAADEAIERLFKNHVKTHYPAHYIKGEETGDETPAHPAQGDNRWVIDPVDGTRNNEYGRDDFAVSIAHQVYEDGNWCSHNALLVSPVKGNILWASKDQGSYKLSYNPLLGEKPAISKVQMDPQTTGKPFNKSLVDLALNITAGQDVQLVEFFRQNHIRRRTIGSSAIAVANTGIQNDGTIVVANDYDVAAGLLFAEQAGAVTSQTSYDGGQGGLTLVVAAQSETLHDALKNQCIETFTNDL